LLCRDGIIERELDPKNLPNDFSEIKSSCDALVAERGGGASPHTVLQFAQPENLHCGEGAAATSK
jgi:hypothetical protein